MFDDMAREGRSEMVVQSTTNRSYRVLASSLLVMSLLVAGHVCAVGPEVEWIPSHGPTGTTVEAFAELPDGTLFAGTKDGVYRFDAEVEAWEYAGLEGGRILNLLATSDGDLIASLYVLTGDFEEVFVMESSDRGETWIDLEFDVASLHLAFAEAADGAIWIGGEYALGRFDPLRLTWTEIAIDGLSGFGLVVDALAAGPSGEVFASCFMAPTAVHGIWRSLDNGENWEQVLSTETSVSELAMTIDGTLVAGTAQYQQSNTGLIFFSSDSGESWIDLTCPGSEGESGCLGFGRLTSLSILDDGTIFAGGRRSNDGRPGGLWRTEGPGHGWTLAAAGSSDVTALRCLDSQSLWIGTPGHIFRSHDRGESLTRSCNGINHTSIQTLLETEASIFALTWKAGIFRSRDLGRSWVFVGLDEHECLDAVVDQRGHIFVATVNGLFTSGDDGDSWEEIPMPGDPELLSIVSTVTGALCAMDGQGTAMCSTDNGASWESGPSGMIHPWHMLAHPDGELVMWNGRPNASEIMISADLGLNWRSIHSAERLSSLTIAEDGTIFAAQVLPCDFWEICSSFIVSTSDLGVSWTGSPTVVDEIDTLAWHRWWGLLASSSGTALVSHDSGFTWVPFGESQRCTDGVCESIIKGGIDAFLFLDDLVLAGTSGHGVYWAVPQYGPRQPGGRRH